MGRKPSKPRRAAVLRLRDLDHSKSAVLNSLGSPASRRAYEFAIDEFIAWYCSEALVACCAPAVMIGGGAAVGAVIGANVSAAPRRWRLIEGGKNQ